MTEQTPEVKSEDVPNGGRPWLQVIVREDRSIQVSGSINDKVLAYGLLEAAKDAVRDHIQSLSQSKLVKPNGFLNGLRGMK